MTVEITFKEYVNRNGHKRKPPTMRFDGFIVGCDEESVTVQHNYNGARTHYKFKDDHVKEVICY